MVIQSTSFDHGGAAIAAKRWAEALGLESNKREAPSLSPTFKIKLLNKILNKLFWSDELYQSRGPISLGLLHQSGPIPADLYFTHWVQNGFLSLSQLAKQSVKSIWYLHDEWLLLGTGHYTSPYYPTSILPIRTRILNHIVGRWKYRYLISPALGICVPSNWLREKLIDRGFPAHRVTVIPNPIPDNFFRPTDKIKARQDLMIPPNEKVILVIASSTVLDIRKGIDLIRPTLEEFVRINGNVSLISVGIKEFELAISGVTHKSLDFVNSESELIRLYASADVLFVPSRLDNLPQVITEAQSVGLPVVAFDVGGVEDAILFPGVSARLVEPYSIPDAAIALSTFCNNLENFDRDIWVLAAQSKWSYASIRRSFTDFFYEIH